MGLGETVVEVVKSNGLRWIGEEDDEPVKRVCDLDRSGWNKSERKTEYFIER